MILTRTVNSDKRYYLDEDLIVNQESLLDTMERFNDMKIALYNVLYLKKYLGTGPLMGQTYSAWLKENYHTNDYYNCAVYTYASGCLSSQSELRKLYIRTKEEDLKTRNSKIESVSGQLEKKRKILASVKEYILTGKWKLPYPNCQVMVRGRKACLPGKKEVPLEDYERQTEEAVRRLKTRLALIRESRNRAARKKTALEEHPPKRIVFGGKKRYREKDKGEMPTDEWKTEFHEARHCSMSLPGRHTSKDCNFLVSRHGNDPAIRCMDGSEAVLKDFRPARYHEAWEGMLSRKPAERRPVCYNFQLKRDRKGRRYLIVSVTLELENRYCNQSFDDGCIGIDLNYDHVALTDIDKDGNRVSNLVLRFDPELKTDGQVSEEIGRVMSRVGRFCRERRKPLVMEDLDTTLTKHGLRYGNRKGNRHASVFAYRKMTACLENQSFKQDFGMIKVNPAYTSQMGKFLFMRRYGISIHEAASYAVGLKGMGMREKLLPDSRLTDLLPKKTKDAVKTGTDMPSLMAAWKKLADAFRGVRVHSFYREIPYHVLVGKKRKSLQSLASEMKNWIAVTF